MFQRLGPPRRSISKYVLPGTAALLAFIAAHPQSMRGCGHEYPHLHRICDVQLGGKLFRVGRCLTCAEELSFEPIDVAIAHLDEAGVPYWLTGMKLANWVDEMMRDGDPKEAIDWERYRPPPST